MTARENVYVQISVISASLWQNQRVVELGTDPSPSPSPIRERARMHKVLAGNINSSLLNPVQGSVSLDADRKKNQTLRKTYLKRKRPVRKKVAIMAIGRVRHLLMEGAVWRGNVTVGES